jgi:hypothetical protein
LILLYIFERAGVGSNIRAKSYVSKLASWIAPVNVQFNICFCNQVIHEKVGRVSAFPHSPGSLSNVAKLTDRLVVLTKDTNYDKDQIVYCASGIVDSAGKLDSSLKALFKSLHSEFQKN